MQRPIAISLSPNIEKDDARLAARRLLQPWRWRRPDPDRERRIEQRLQRAVGQPHAVLTNSGRAGITQLLRAAGIGDGDEVMLQAFTCLVVPNAIRQAGAAPIYADIAPGTYNLNPEDVAQKITPRTKALIIQHTFGIPAPLEQLLKIARAHQLFVIEDCAHALGGTLAGRPLGSFGDAAILSFGRDKVLSSVFGGAIAIRDDALAAALRREVHSRPLPPRWWIAQQLFHPLYLWHIVLPLYFIAGIGKLKLVAAQKLGLLSRAVAPEEYHGRPPAFHEWRFAPALLPLLELQLEKLPRYTARRRRIAAAYSAAFPQALSPPATAQPLLRFPLRVGNQAPLLFAARDRRMLLDDWYGAPVVPEVPAAVSGYSPGGCPQAEKAAEEIINLPTYPRLTDHQVKRVITFMKDQAKIFQ